MLGLDVECIVGLCVVFGVNGDFDGFNVGDVDGDAVVG